MTTRNITGYHPDDHVGLELLRVARLISPGLDLDQIIPHANTLLDWVKSGDSTDDRLLRYHAIKDAYLGKPPGAEMTVRDLLADAEKAVQAIEAMVR